MPKNLTIRFDDDTRERLELIANREVRPMANQIMFFVKQGIAQYLKQNDLQFVYINDESGEDFLQLELRHAQDSCFPE